jgi:hypothetical protein
LIVYGVAETAGHGTGTVGVMLAVYALCASCWAATVGTCAMILQRRAVRLLTRQTEYMGRADARAVRDGGDAPTPG